MKFLKSHFWYNKHQRNGIFFLLLIIVVLQVVYVFLNFGSEERVEIDSKEILAFQNKIDSLKTIEIERRKPKLYPFNPNYITDYKGYQLGMSVDEIDRLHQFRKQRKFVNSIKEFQQITKVSDSLIRKISPYFKFPDWVVKRNQQLAKKKSKLRVFVSNKEDDNTVNSEKSKEIVKINVNTATFKQLLAVPDINYDLCKKILDYRDEVAELQNISELKNIEGFPLYKYDRIILYLEAK